MRRVAGLLVVGVAVVLCCGVGCERREGPHPEPTSTMTADTETRKPNRLVHEKSPYLLQHAYNPVDWYPWGTEAFERSRKENKPIFLSIGYSTCHWCHVMERESFENDDVATVMNQYFVCIKVDREERPDIDKIYMTAVQATTGSGGWPMSVWLTPDLKPFFCGTYFPPETKWGRPGFKDLLQRVHDVWESNRNGVVAQADQITEALVQHVGVGRGGPPSSAEALAKAEGGLPLDDSPFRLGFEQFRGSYDEVHGGFGGAPKFPRPVVLNFLFRYSAVGAGARQAVPLPEEATKARDMALHTLEEMAKGGMFDQLGGGFHRYSVDDHWLVSHFEKMLYDQAQLVSSYIDAYQITHDPFYADIARRTCDYVLRDMTNPEGGFYSAEDADSEGVEGRFYVWTWEEVERVLGGRGSTRAAGGSTGVEPSMSQEPIDIFCRSYGVERDGNWEHGLNILHVTNVEAPADVRAACRAKLFAAREKRVRPHRDEKVLTSWNGLMISAFARAAQVLPESWSGLGAATVGALKPLPHSPDYLAAAQRAAHYILTKHYKTGQLLRTATVPAVLDDYACFASGLLDLYETDFDPQWLLKAVELTDKMIDLFYDEKDGGFFQADGRDASVIVRAKEDYDGAEPSGNSTATLLLLRLAEFTGESSSVAAVGDRGGDTADRARRARLQSYHEAAEKTLGLFGEHLHRAPHAVPQMLCALDFALSKPKQVVITGKPGAPDTGAMLSAVRQHYLPNKIVILADGGAFQKTLSKLLPFLESIKSIDAKAAAYVCVNYACQLPTTDVARMKQLLGAGLAPRAADGTGN